MNTKEHYVTVAFLFPTIVDKLIARLSIPDTYVKYIDQKFGDKQESGVFYFKNEQEKNNAISTGDLMGESYFGAQILNNVDEGRVIILKVAPNFAPSWVNENNQINDLRDVFKDIANDTFLGRFGAAYAVKLVMK